MRVLEGGGTQGDADRDYAAWLGRPSDEIEEELPTLPDGLEVLWGAFWDLSVARPSGFGSSPISFQDLKAYSSLHRIRFTSWEVETLGMLDLIWLADRAEQQKLNQNKGTT